MSEKERNSPVNDKSPSLMAKKLNNADKQKQVAKGIEYFSSPWITFNLKPFWIKNEPTKNKRVKKTETAEKVNTALCLYHFLKKLNFLEENLKSKNYYDKKSPKQKLQKN